MKKYFLWLMMGFCVALTFTACGDDDDDDDDRIPNSSVDGGGSSLVFEQVIGTWERQYSKETKINPNGQVVKEEYDNDPDWLVIKSDQTWEYWDYSHEDQDRELEFMGALVVVNGIVKGNGQTTFSEATVSNNILTIKYSRYDYDDGVRYTKKIEESYKKIK